MITSKEKISQPVAVESTKQKDKVEFSQTTYLTIGALILIIIGIIAAQNDNVQAIPDHLFQKLRAISSSSQTF